MNILADSQISRLLDIANAGCHKGCVYDARIIYDSVLTLKPGHVPALIGRALSHIVVSDFAAAEAMLRDILSEHGEDADAKCLLGLCLMMQKREEGRVMLSSLQERDDSAGKLAKELLEGAC